MLAFERFGAFTGSATTTTGGWPTLSSEELLAKMEKATEMVEELVNITAIRIWKGEDGLFHNIKLRPELHFSEYLPDNNLFLLAGEGVVAGAKAYQLMRRMGVQLVWSDEFIPLAEQESEAAKILAKWEVKGKKNA